MEVIDTLKIHAQPTVVLISTRSDERLEMHLSREARGIDRGDLASEFILYLVRNGLIGLVDNILGSYVLDARPSSDFGYMAGKNKLINLELGSDERSQIGRASCRERV